MDLYLHSFSDRILLITLALYLSAAAGGALALHRLLFLDKPALILRAFFAACERKLNRAQRSTATRRLRGFLLVLFTLGLCMGMGYLGGRLAESSHFSLVPEVALLAYLLPLHASIDRVRQLRQALHDKEMTKAAKLAVPLARRDEVPSDAFGMQRVAIEYLALQFARRIVTPLCWYLVLGLPAFLFVVALAMMDDLFGSRAKAYAPFGATAARLNMLAQLLPTRVAAMVLVLTCLFSPACSLSRAFKGMIGGSTQTLSPNSGVMLGAAAGALGVTVAGPRNFLGWAVKDEWIDYGTARVEAVHLARMQYLYAYACGLLVLLLTAMNIQTFPSLL